MAEQNKPHRYTTHQGNHSEAWFASVRDGENTLLVDGAATAGAGARGFIKMPVRVRLKQSSATKPGLLATSSMCCQHVRYAKRSGWSPAPPTEGHEIHVRQNAEEQRKRDTSCPVAPIVVWTRTVEYVNGTVALVSVGPVRFA